MAAKSKVLEEKATPPRATKIRHQYNFTARTELELAFVEAELGTTNETEAVRWAISLTAWIIQLQKDGGKVAIKHPDGQIEGIKIFTPPSARELDATEAPSAHPEYRIS